MSIISTQMSSSIQNGSWIRRMFEAGIQLKQKYGDKLVFHGGINAVLWSKPDEIRAEIERVVPVMKQGGGYIFASDHSIPDNISLENFKLVLETLRRVGSY